MNAAAPESREQVRLLDIEPALAARLRDDDRAEARERLRLRTVTLPKGELSLDAEDARTHPFGLIVVDGVLLGEVQLGGRCSHQLLGHGDVVLTGVAADGSLDVAQRLVVATPARIAVLDDRLQAPFALWPGLALGLLERVGAQLARAAVQSAIAQLPRVEDRLEATFWNLADRWGRVTPAGIHIPLQLTHEGLARVAGGRRPTITLALARLAERGVVRRRDDGTWLLEAERPTLAPNAPAPAPPPVALALDPSAEPDVPPPQAGQPVAGEQLLAAARRMSAEHERATESIRTDQQRYAKTRLRSLELRDDAQVARAERARRRAEVRPRAPAGPSGG